MMARVGFIRKMTRIKGQKEVKGASHVDICRKSIPGRGSKFKGSEVGVCLVFLRTSEGGHNGWIVVDEVSMIT